jgi:hypothetical protein
LVKHKDCPLCRKDKKSEAFHFLRPEEDIKQVEKDIKRKLSETFNATE